MRKLIALTMALALSAVACGGGSGPDPADDPNGALRAALERLAEYEGVEMSLRLSSDAESLVALSEGDLDADTAEQVLGSSLVIRSKTADDPADSQFELAANIAGIEDAVELKAVGDTLYVRGDVEGLASTFGADTAGIDGFAAQAASQPGFEFVGPALEGEWIGISGLTEGMKALTGAVGATETPSEEDTKAIEQLTDALADAAQVTQGDKEGPGTNLVATVDIRKAFESFSAFASELGNLPAGTALPPGSDIPEGEVAIDVWIDGGDLTQVQFDFTQLAEFTDDPMPEGVNELALTLGIAEFTDAIEAPEDAATVDFQQLFQGLFQGFAGSESSETSPVPGDICAELATQLADQPQEVIDQVASQFEAECPDLADQLGG